VQRRLSAAEVEALIGQYRRGASIDVLARRYEVHRTTVTDHIDRAPWSIDINAQDVELP